MENFFIISIAECQQRNLRICRHYCMNGNIINTFKVLAFSGKIADSEIEEILADTTIYRAARRQGHF
jgi:hypothetical protein